MLTQQISDGGIDRKYASHADTQEKVKLRDIIGLNRFLTTRGLKKSRKGIPPSRMRRNRLT